MTSTALTAHIREKKSFLCVGLDTDITKIPAHLQNSEDPLFEFNKAIIEATHAYCVAYKPNTAFYEAQGLSGWNALQKTISYLNTYYPNHFTIADAKRGDIGNTSRMYAKAFFETLDFDSVTVAPYMGEDSVAPFLEFPNKFAILLALTSNAGSANFQKQPLQNTTLYKHVIKTTQSWANAERLMYVVGATQTQSLAEIRELIPNAFLLVPGVGAQGGNLEAVCQYGMNANVGLLVNASRSIIYASNDTNFAEAARLEASKIQQKMATLLV